MVWCGVAWSGIFTVRFSFARFASCPWLGVWSGAISRRSVAPCSALRSCCLDLDVDKI